MRARPRIVEYHRRRQRLVRGRRIGSRSRLWNRVPTHSQRAPQRSCPADMDGGLRDSLRELIRRVSRYRAVTGLLFRHRDGRIWLWLVAAPPMTAPLRLLASAWCAKLAVTHPDVEWSLRVAPRPPHLGQRYQRLYWCGR